jgi:predicted O-linked N-acetylglucosamine transferase (SPINDLY family)
MKTLSAKKYCSEMEKFGQVKTKKETLKRKQNLFSCAELIQKRIIELVEQKQELWNKSHLKYADNYVKNRSWNEINATLAKENHKNANGNLILFYFIQRISFSDDPVDARKVFNSMVSKYSREATSLKKRPSGSSPVKGKWSLFDSMKFIGKSSDDST